MSNHMTRDMLAGSGFCTSASSFLKRHIAPIVLAMFATAGFWVLDDYGVGTDVGVQRETAIRNLDYMLGRRDFIYPDYIHDRFYGVSFELPLLLLERALGLDDTRDIHLMRHIITHLFFLVGGFFCYLLAYRLFGSRPLALFAMLLFLLHPRVYAHSFFNTKDIPFLSMFMVCLYLVHRAFDRRDVWRFLILGVAVGVLINLRIMGVTLFVMIVGMHALYVFGDRRYLLGSMGLFVLSCAATLYAVSPSLWGDPIGNFAEWIAVLSQHPTSITQMFRGDVIISTDINPPEYIPVWMSITTPPAALVLGVVGMMIVFLRGLMNPRDVFMNMHLRFWFMLACCFITPIVASIVLSSNVYYGWRQVYFLYAPFCLLALFGLYQLMVTCDGLCLSVFSRVVDGEKLMYGAFGIGCAVVVASMVSIHPHQHVYFNFLVDRVSPDHLRTRYDMDYWTTTFREGYEHLLERYPSASIHALTSVHGSGVMNWQILTASDRERLILDGGSFDFYITNYQSIEPVESARRDVTAPLVHSRVIYGSKVLGVAAVDLSLVDEAVAALYRDVYSATVSKRPDAGSEWDVYVDDATLTYIKEPCTADDHEPPPFFLHVTPDDIDDIPNYRRRAGHATRVFDFDFGRYGVIFDGKCMAVITLPDDGISGVRTGQFTSDDELWGVAVNLRTGGKSAYRAEYESVVRDGPAISSEFDVHLRDGRLVYVREPCDASDVEAEFFLQVVPSDVEALPPVRVDSGFDYLRFVFETRGLMFDDICVASIGLPNYGIERIRTGQLVADDGTVSWEGGYNVSAAVELPRVVDELRGHGTDQMIQSHYDVYLDEGRLVYFRSSCVSDDAEAPFFLHLYPADVGVLPPGRRSSGFDSFSFMLLDQGVTVGDGCFTSFDLPDYEIAGFMTGQFVRADGSLWEDGHSFIAAELLRKVERLRGSGAEPVARSYFDVYLYDDRLIYVKDSCSVSDTTAKFFLHVVPSSVDDLPPSRVESGFDNLGFGFETHGLMLDGVCIIGAGLPNYEMERVRTGQWDPEQQHNLWKEEFYIGK